MGRKGRLRSAVLRITVHAVLSYAFIACSTIQEEADVKVSFNGEELTVKSVSPDEDKITDISLLIFDESGNAEELIWLPKGQMSCSTTLVSNKKYTFCACANFGSQVYARDISELKEIIFHLAYPDEYKEGIPMAAMEEIMITGDSSIELCLQRLMARISLRMDRSRLNDDVQMNVRSVKIGNCPRYVRPFTQSRIESGDDAFPVGFLLNDMQTADLNYSIGKGLSKEVSLYMFENMQGGTEFPVRHDSEKVFGPHDPRSQICSYIEMQIDYLSDELASGEKGLIYRFYLGEDRNSFDVIRNTHYHITVTPENDGLKEDSWRVDKSDLEEQGPVYFQAYPADYIQGDIGDKIHIWCDFSPSDTPFDVGISYMEDDKAEGIYDYELDADGHGAVLTLTGPGMGLIYMEAGVPVNEAALFIIIVNQP